MSGPTELSLSAVVVTTFDTVSLGRLTVRSLLDRGSLPCLVVDLDGTYAPVGGETVIGLAEVVAEERLGHEASRAAATLEPAEFCFYSSVLGARHVLAQGAAGALVLGAGVLVLDDLRDLLDGADAMVVPGADATGAVRLASASQHRIQRDQRTGLLSVEGPGAGPVHSRAVLTLRTTDQADSLRSLAADWRTSSTALDIFAGVADVTVVRDPSVVVGPWRAVPETTSDGDRGVRVGGARLRALDLSSVDARRPWTLDSRALTSPRVLLSEHPVLADLVRSAADEMLADVEAHVAGQAGTPMRVRLDPALRSEARRADRAGGELPDLLALEAGPDLSAWALSLVPDGDPRPVARYLAAVRHARADLQQAFPEVPGPDATRLAKWAQKSGVHEPFYDPDLLARAAVVTLERQAGPIPARRRLGRGVNLVGYLAGELGLGESARLVDQALQAAGVPTSTYDVSRDLGSRRAATFRRSEPVTYRTSLVCLNGAETAAAAPQLRTLLKRTRVIGMWYWELEELPPAYQAGFQYVDEVWAASDFMREAIARHAGDVPVHTVTPPLPQAGADPGEVPVDLGIPSDRPWFLFTFDFLSMADRKNPDGLVEAFTRAFGHLAPAERPLLVIKTINADRSPADAERLRLHIGDRSDVLFLDTYLDHDQRHVLVAHCTAYVSLHKAEGLGLTVAEAMAWGRPVITTAYGGVTQFCTPDNSFLVDWSPGQVERTTGPYERGMAWAEPDLDQAAALMRAVLDEPERTAAVGLRAAADIRDLHNAEVAGARIREVLDVGDARWDAAGPEAVDHVEADQNGADRDGRDRGGAGLDPPEPAGRVPARLRGLASVWRRRNRS